MKISVKVKTGKQLNSVKEISKDTYEISVNARPVKGSANTQVIELISQYFNISKTSVKIIKGFKSKSKLIEIEVENKN